MLTRRDEERRKEGGIMLLLVEIPCRSEVSGFYSTASGNLLLVSVSGVTRVLGAQGQKQ